MEERLFKTENPFKRYNNLTKEERDALYSLRDDSTIIIKGAGKGSVVVVWDRKNYLNEAYQDLEDREVYKEVPIIIINSLFYISKKFQGKT